jgi:hypothetical protein
VCALYNIIEDDGMERERALEWRGDKKALTTMNENIVEQVAQSWESAALDPKCDLSAQPAEPLAAMSLGRLSSLDWDGENDIVTGRLINAMPPQAQELLTELVQEDWIARMRAGTNPHDTWDITIDLAKRLYPDHDDEQYEEMREDGHHAQATRDKAKDDTPANMVPGQGPDMEESDGAGDRQTDDDRIVSWKECVISEHNEWTADDGMAPGGFGIDWSGHTGGTVALMPTNQVNVVDLAKRKNVRANGRGGGWGYTKWDEYMPTDEHSKVFANRVRRYIQAQARSVVEKEKYSGRLDRGALVRLVLPPIDGGEYNKRIFYDQRKHTMKDTAIFVLTDWSGSMTGRKMKYAADASQRLVHTFDRVLNVPVALACFSNRNTACDVGYIKKFNTRGLPAEEIARRFADFYKWSCANNDADALNWAYHEILKRNESRKMLLVLSDGCPAGQWAGNGDENLRYIANEIETSGRVELYGVGIRSDAVEEYYTNVKVVDDPANINDVLFNIIKDGNNARTNRR